MAAVTRAGDTRRRRWLAGGLVGAWVAVLAGLAVWSVGHEPATVPEQRDIGQAVPRLQEAAGVVAAAAGGPGRAVVLGELAFSRDCRVTPVRAGVDAVRDVVVHVRAGQARAMVEALAAGLPAGYSAEVATWRAGTRLSLHADAGDFIGIDAEAAAAARTVTVRLSTGCRPLADGVPGRVDASVDGVPGRVGPSAGGVPGRVGPSAGGVPGRVGPSAGGVPGPEDPPAGSAPVLLGDVVAALGATPVRPSESPSAEVRAVPCPGGKVAATWVVDTPRIPADVDARLRPVVGTAGVVRDDGDVRAYRVGEESVVVESDGDRGRVSVGTGCR